MQVQPHARTDDRSIIYVRLLRTYGTSADPVNVGGPEARPARQYGVRVRDTVVTTTPRGRICCSLAPACAMSSVVRGPWQRNNNAMRGPLRAAVRNVTSRRQQPAWVWCGLWRAAGFRGTSAQARAGPIGPAS